MRTNDDPGVVDESEKPCVCCWCSFNVPPGAPERGRGQLVDVLRAGAVDVCKMDYLQVQWLEVCCCSLYGVLRNENVKQGNKKRNASHAVIHGDGVDEGSVGGVGVGSGSGGGGGRGLQNDRSHTCCTSQAHHSLVEHDEPCRRR